ncbi:MAG: endonuclease/exonuclease/phosphatase family protein [Phycisphaerales bacterium]|nr:MAG: endonuclease/exonuclease/phosphatase family protein [Phycisphaerales bacterium]
MPGDHSHHDRDGTPRPSHASHVPRLFDQERHTDRSVPGVARVLFWNILHGGGRERIASIALAIMDHHPDVVVLCEFRRSIGGQIVGLLADRGLSHHHATNPGTTTTGQSRNGVLIASRWAITPGHQGVLGRKFPGRWLDVEIAELGLALSGIHAPDDTQAGVKAEFWNEVIALARVRTTESRPWLIAGDANTGRHGIDEKGKTFRFPALLGTLVTLGMADLWRDANPDSREVSWRSGDANGTRIDTAFASPALRPRVISARFSHAERESGLSDHSILLVDIAPQPAEFRGENAKFLRPEEENM